MRVGDLIILHDRAYQVDKIIYSRKDETLFLLQVVDSETDEPFWLKLVFGEAELLHQVLTEAKSLVKLALPQLPTVKSFDRDEEKFWMLMSRVSGRTLREWMDENEQGDLAELDAKLSLFLRLCEAVEEIHKFEYFFGDLKPDNILLCKKDGGAPVIRFADYGLSTLTNHLKAGAEQYWAPERDLGGRTSLGPWSDLYSLGLICIELLVGRLPVRYAYRNSTEWVKFERPGEIMEGFPEQLELLLMKAVAYQKDNRFSSVAEFRMKLQRFLQLSETPAQAAASAESRTSTFELLPNSSSSEGNFGPYFLLLMGMFIGAILIWDSQSKPTTPFNIEAEPPRPAITDNLDTLPEPVVIITPVAPTLAPKPEPTPKSEPVPQLEPIPAPVAKTPAIQAPPPVTLLEKEPVQPEVAMALESEAESETLPEPTPEPAPEPTPEPTTEPTPEPPPEPAPEPEVQPVVQPQPRVEKLSEYRAEIERYQLAAWTNPEDPGNHFRLAAASYTLGILEKDANQLIAAKENFSTALEFGADLVACELAFRVTELCMAVLNDSQEVGKTVAELVRVQKTLQKAETRASSGAAYFYGDWMFLVTLSAVYQDILSGVTVACGSDNHDDPLTAEQKDFLDQVVDCKECLLPPTELLGFMRL